MDQQLFDSIKSKEQPLAEQVAEQISHLIIKQHIARGEKLPNEFEIADQLNVGRGTIREAVKLLVARNVLEIRRGKGTFVSKHTGVVEDPLGFAYIKDNFKLANDLLEMRLLIEPWAAKIAAERATKENVEKLEKAFENLKEKLIHCENHLPADEKFHVALAYCTQSLVVPKIIPVIIYSVYQLGPMNTTFCDYEEVRQSALKTHQNIMDAIINHDPHAAEKAMIEHLENNRKAIGCAENEQNIQY